MRLFKEPESSTFALKSGDDLLNQANPVIQYRPHRFSSNALNIAESYMHSNLYVEVEARSSHESADFYLIFEAIPSGFTQETDQTSCPGSISERCRRGQFNDSLVFMGITRIVECPERIIPSFVWATRTKDRVNFDRYIPSTPLDLTFEVSGAIGKGESRSVLSSAMLADSNSMNGTIKSGAQIVDSIVQGASQGIQRDRVNDPDFQDLVLRSIRIRLQKLCVLVSTPPPTELCCQFIPEILRTRNLSA